MKGWSPFTENKESWWTRTKRQFSSENKYGFGDARGRGKSASTEQISHQQKNPRKRGETYKDYIARIGSPSEKKTVNVQGLPGTGESSQK